MTMKELSILRMNGIEVTLTFSDTGVLKKKVKVVKKKKEDKEEEEFIETDFLRKNPGKYVEIIDNVLKNENIHDAIAVSGVFVDDNGDIIEQEGFLGNIFYTNIISKDSKEYAQGK